jgi:signal transduction histidine kinase
VAVAAAAAPRLPAPARVLVAAVSAAGAGILAVRAVQVAEAPLSTVGAALLILAASVLADRFTLSVAHGGEEEEFSLADAVWVAAIVLAPPGAPTLGAAAGALCWQLARRVPAAKTAFNVGQVALALTAAEVIWGLADPAPLPDETAAWVFGAAAAAAAFVVNVSTVALVIALVQRQPFRTILLGSFRVSALQWVGNVAIGLLAALAWHVNPAGLVLVAVPLGLVYLAYRDWVAGLVEREQMEDMARTAERIARDGDPAARLPMDGREGRLAQLTASLNRMLEQLDRAFGRDRHLMKEAAAELHDPVRAIRRELAVLGGDADADAGAGDAAATRERLACELDRVDQVLSEMEAVASAGRPGAVRPASVPLDPFLRRVGDRARVLLDDRLTVASLPGDAVARLDAMWIERALLHMLDNAAIHGRCSSPVTLSAAHVPGGWRFEVADEGGGVPAGHEEAVFEPFYRAGSVPGRPGLGLALVQSVAEAHGGSTGIVNRPGVGATFWLRVPA